MFSSRGLITTNDLTHPSTLFLHKQTFKILNFNPSYLSAFDVMQYECGVKDKEDLMFFLRHMVQRKVYVIEDWDSTISTVETLMYDHGLIGPEDGSRHDFYKGECDASFENGTAKLSVIIWKGDKIIHVEVYLDIKCNSATEAEAFAAFALLSKAHDMKILKLLVCSDCKAVCEVLSGALSIGKHHPHRNLYLMLRSMRRHFDKLIVTWKPRELMIFTDELAKAGALASSTVTFPLECLRRWSHHLKGLPIFRIERTIETNRKIAKFANLEVEESYGKNENFIFFVEVQEQCKLDCLFGLQQAFKPNKLKILVTDTEDKPDHLCRELKEIIDIGFGVKSGKYVTYSNSTEVVSEKFLVVICDASIPKECYHHDCAFHVILVTPDERKDMIGREIPELNALTFVYFNGVRFPLNKKQNEEGARQRRKSSSHGNAT